MRMVSHKSAQRRSLVILLSAVSKILLISSINNDNNYDIIEGNFPFLSSFRLQNVKKNILIFICKTHVGCDAGNNEYEVLKW